MIRLFPLLVIFSLVLICDPDLHARQVQSETDQSLLPEIDPQDIEIRSQFQARFPGLRRQPILGFNPRPRVFQRDPNRIPFLESGEAVAANLPIGRLERPEGPEYRLLGYAEPRNAFFRAGIGSEISPEADLYGVASLGQRNWISGSLSLESSKGHEERVTTSYRYLDTAVRSFHRLSNKTTLRFNSGLTSDFNHMLQLGSTDPALLNTDTRVEMTGFRGGAELDVEQTSLSGLRISANGYTNRFELNSDLPDFNAPASEWGASLHGEYSRLGSRINEIQKLRLESYSGGINSDSGGNELWTVNRLSAAYERLLNYRTDIKASLGFSAVTDAVNDFTFYLSPEVEVKHTFFTGFGVRGFFSGSPSHTSYGELLQENRFFGLNSVLEHQFEWMAGGELFTEPFFGTRILGGASWQNVKNYLYYVRESSPLISVPAVTEGYYQALFADATQIRVYGSFSQDLNPGVLWINGDAYWQIPNLSGGDRIPYTETLGIKGAVSFRPAREVLIEGWADFTSGRKDPAGQSMNAYTIIGARFEISVTGRYGIYGKLLNLMNEEYELWNGYQERGFQGFVGLTILL
ncbi:MAG: hypothetical protein EA360_06180 [Balneolaceae bacterium]|nr:MAG: hypothetical protein EA360_06180 [Balneolaceae bacterium]